MVFGGIAFCRWGRRRRHTSCDTAHLIFNMIIEVGEYHLPYSHMLRPLAAALAAALAVRLPTGGVGSGREARGLGSGPDTF